MFSKVLLLLFVMVLSYSGQFGYAVPSECQNYKSLSSRDRSAEVPRGNVLQCDQTLIKTKGWYRFSGDAGNAMATKAPKINYCGTHAPGWMQGSHPTVAEGAVTRKVCYHWSSNVCNWNNNIRVRNCGEFYVYELDRTPVCHLRYCGNGISGPVVTAAPPNEGQNNLPVLHTVECKSNGIVIKIQKKSLQYAVSSDLRLLDPTCLPTEQEGNFVFQFDLDKCGTVVETKPTELIYRNEVLGQVVPKPKITQRIGDIRVKVQCSYSRKMDLVSQNIEPKQDKFRAESEHDGKLSSSIQMYPDDTFGKPFESFPAKLDLRQPLFVEVSVKSETKAVSILAQKCYATPTKEDAQPNHDLIVDGCAVDDTLTFLQSPSKNIQRFQVQTFRFKENKPFVYVHCHVIICDANKEDSVCAKGCQNEAKKREFDGESGSLKTQKLTQGPFAIGHSEPTVDQDETDQGLGRDGEDA